MVKQINCHPLYPCGLDKLYLIVFLALVLILVSCAPFLLTSTESTVQPALPTPTLEPTFTPSPALTDALMPSPTPTPEPTPTPLPQASLSGRILDQASSQPIIGAKVSAGTATVATDADGRYALTGLPPDQYVLSVTHPDYDPGLSSIFTLAAGQELALDLTLFAPDTSPYPRDPMLTNPLDPNGAPTKEDAERLARLQGLTGKIVSIEETKLRGEFLVNYKIGEEIRTAVAELNHDIWELTDQAGRKWWIIKVCGNLASLLPQEVPIATPAPRPLPPMAEVLIDGLVVRTCASEDCTEVGSVTIGTLIEVFGCLADGGWCEVGWTGGRGWCTGRSLRQLAVATVIPEATPVLPTPIPTITPGVIAEGERKIAFFCERGENYSLHVINADGSDLTLLSNAAYPQWRGPAWSPDGRKIAFTSNANGKSGIYMINVDGSSLTYLTHGGDPTWSPDGHRIAFPGSYGTGEFDSDIFVINIDGSGLTRLTDMGRLTGREWLGYWNPTWSPDGQRISFESQPDLRRIYVVNADGSDLTQLTVDNVDGYEPTWSPDSQYITFRSYSGGKTVSCGKSLSGIYITNVNGAGLRPLTPSDFLVWSASWSPDSQQIVFSSSHDDSDYPNCLCPDWKCKTDIYKMSIDGNNLTRLTDNAAEERTPVWSPDGQQIVFVSDYDDGGLYVMNADGSNQTQLTNICDKPYAPTWSP